MDANYVLPLTCVSSLVRSKIININSPRDSRSKTIKEFWSLAVQTKMRVQDKDVHYSLSLFYVFLYVHHIR